MSIRLKIALWFSIALLLVVTITFLVILSVSNTVIQKNSRENLIELVENNFDEIEFFEQLPPLDNDADQYIAYKEGYLQIDDDYLDMLNGISTSLYTKEGTLLYGENPLAEINSSISFNGHIIQNTEFHGTRYYIYDKALTSVGTEGLYLRGVVSENQGKTQLSSIANFSLVLMPLLVILAIAGGIIISDRAFEPLVQLNKAASGISNGSDLKQRIDVGEGKDELHQLAGTFNSMIERLDKSFEAEKQFTSDLSHELRTPMTVILSQCDILDDTSTIEDYRDGITVIERQSRRMSKLINDMLDFSRLDKHIDRIDMSKIDFSDLVLGICMDMALIADKNITLDYDIEESLWINGNTGLLSRMVSNLISNAYRYGNNDGHIWVKLIREDNSIKLSVKDDGIGIAQSDTERIFDRFYQVSQSRKNDGNGLGLAMVKQIATVHNGNIYVISELGSGSEFIVNLPVG